MLDAVEAAYAQKCPTPGSLKHAPRFSHQTTARDDHRVRAPQYRPGLRTHLGSISSTIAPARVVTLRSVVFKPLRLIAVGSNRRMSTRMRSSSMVIPGGSVTMAGSVDAAMATNWTAARASARGRDDREGAADPRSRWRRKWQEGMSVPTADLAVTRLPSSLWIWTSRTLLPSGRLRHKLVDQAIGDGIVAATSVPSKSGSRPAAAVRRARKSPDP
jgi:hypothetical protein